MTRRAHQFPDDPDAPDWLKRLREECRRHGIKATGEKLGYARTSISLVAHGRYPGPTDGIEAAMARYLDRMIPCPHLKREITSAACAAAGAGPMPTNDPDRFRLWTACQTCPLRPKEKT